MNFTEGIDLAEKTILPSSLAATALIPGLPVPVTLLIAGLPKLMTAYQNMFPSGGGPVKLAGVLGAVQASCDVIDGQLTGGAKESFERVRPIATQFINGSIAAINAAANVQTDAEIDRLYEQAKKDMEAAGPEPKVGS